MSRQLSEELEQDFFFVHSGIVYGAVKTCGIRYDHPDYDDLVQTGLIKLVEAYQTYPEDLLQEEYIYQFTGYAFQKVRWALIDELRKTSRQQKRETVLPDYDSVGETERGVSMNEDWLVWELLPSMLSLLTENEQGYLKDAVIKQLSVTEIASTYGVSRKTVYQWKKRIAVKLDSFKHILKQG
ncbi:hypothetical protein ADIAL_1258 [Alkalibacterium sp. AK22]|uniref:sigma-70 family RNA polymerase sigma factor n=1 Tax=Alkalibacterium sp. AK22 TaxID=1229520 RepID=UPI00044774A5|nr:sigma-70 family RNA polymerase sigma factor [Alkalibacterium sp. AK22]EXJ23350.1 hypothetical protein ADIAL_1258 [Alkalibacterium sp. AK22]